MQQHSATSQDRQTRWKPHSAARTATKCNRNKSFSVCVCVCEPLNEHNYGKTPPVPPRTLGCVQRALNSSPTEDSVRAAGLGPCYGARNSEQKSSWWTSCGSLVLSALLLDRAWYTHTDPQCSRQGWDLCSHPSWVFIPWVSSLKQRHILTLQLLS